MALHLARPKRRSLTNPSLFHLFSTSSNNPNNNDESSSNGRNSDNNSSSFSSYFSDVKASLKQQPKERPPSPFSRNPTNPSVPTSNPIPVAASFEEIRKNLSEFRRRSAVPPPTDSSPTQSQSQSQPSISFQELYKRNVLGKQQGESNESPAMSPAGGKLSFDAIRQSLRQMGQQSGANNAERKTAPSLSLTDYKNTLRLKPSDGSGVSSLIGGTTVLPLSVFDKERKEKTRVADSRIDTEFVKMYSHGELGEKLRLLRPEKREEGWFSLQELNERLMKLREMEKKENESRISGVPYAELRESLVKLKMSENEKLKKNALQISVALESQRVACWSFLHLAKSGPSWQRAKVAVQSDSAKAALVDLDTTSQLIGPGLANWGEEIESNFLGILRPLIDYCASILMVNNHRVDILDHLGRTPNFMLLPPQNELVDKASYDPHANKAFDAHVTMSRLFYQVYLTSNLWYFSANTFPLQYFHPDNMSSAEKLKIELAKVRDEFKTSESDCGSARVQVAQLTIKIKHLSSVLHKKLLILFILNSFGPFGIVKLSAAKFLKWFSGNDSLGGPALPKADKHSRKGLQEMVQKRKKLLKYLRRTDWDSYCLVLSKLGLRDNPDYKY
ncbi:Ribosomal protein S15 [Corchorus olitorius]|uniref:Ribosomal protein S15 n=1 Tax=Corchorus olitorius TaxID=93759 RepID=A0A1R3K320_9ROSI|nr:Ribosomal protein S15 [Corchorus olitorius]